MIFAYKYCLDEITRLVILISYDSEPYLDGASSLLPGRWSYWSDLPKSIADEGTHAGFGSVQVDGFFEIGWFEDCGYANIMEYYSSCVTLPPSPASIVVKCLHLDVVGATKLPRFRPCDTSQVLYGGW